MLILKVQLLVNIGLSFHEEQNFSERLSFLHQYLLLSEANQLGEGRDHSDHKFVLFLHRKESTSK